MKYWILLVALTASAFARDNLDSTRGRGWSPDSNWLAFNPVNQDNLLILNLAGGRNFLLKPTGDILLDTSNVIAPSQNLKGTNIVEQVERGPESFAVAISSPGREKLEPLEWAPRSDTIVYSVERQRRATFSVLDQSVTGTYTPTDYLPWKQPEELRAFFDFERTTTNRPSRYLLRVRKPNNALVKELIFQEPREVQRLGLLRGTESTFLTTDGQRLIYPRFKDGRWQLFTETVAEPSTPEPLTAPAPGAPYEWRLSPDGRHLAVVENATTLSVGPVTDWAKADHLTYSNLTLSVAWSPDGRYLAANDRQNLFLVEFDKGTGKFVGQLTRVYEKCSTQFWGWRGSRLIFGNASGYPADLYYIDTAEANRQSRLLVKSRDWKSAPVLRTISPDGNTFVCLFMEIDGSGRLVHEIWRIKLDPTADWELFRRWIPSAEADRR